MELLIQLTAVPVGLAALLGVATHFRTFILTLYDKRHRRSNTVIRAALRHASEQAQNQRYDEEGNDVIAMVRAARLRRWWGKSKWLIFAVLFAIALAAAVRGGRTAEEAPIAALGWIALAVCIEAAIIARHVAVLRRSEALFNARAEVDQDEDVV